MASCFFLLVGGDADMAVRPYFSGRTPYISPFCRKFWGGTVNGPLLTLDLDCYYVIIVIVIILGF